MRNYYPLAPNGHLISKKRYLQIDDFLYLVEYSPDLPGGRVIGPAIPENAWFRVDGHAVFAAAAPPSGPSTTPFYTIQMVTLEPDCELPCLVTAEAHPSGKPGMPEFVIR